MELSQRNNLERGESAMGEYFNLAQRTLSALSSVELSRRKLFVRIEELAEGNRLGDFMVCNFPMSCLNLSNMV